LGRSRGGLSTKIHLLANGLGEPIGFRLTGGQAGEFAEALPLLAGRQAEIVMADRGYDSNAIVAAIESIGAEAVIPSKICRKVQRPHDRTLYKLRNRIGAASIGSSNSADSPPGTANDGPPSRQPSP
jgi:transposase